jgi:hypothetical protein
MPYKTGLPDFYPLFNLLAHFLYGKVKKTGVLICPENLVD